MRAVLLAAVLVAVAQGYVLLKNRAFLKLQDANGGQSLNSSTYNRVAYDGATNLLFATAKEPGRFSVFTMSYLGVPSLVTVIPLDTATRGQPLDVEFCRPNAAGGVPRLAISFTDPSNPAADGTVRLYRAVSPVNPTLDLIQTITVGAQPVDMEFAQDCNVLVVANQGRPAPDLSSTLDPEGSITKIMLPFALAENSVVTVTTIGFSALFSSSFGQEYLMELAESNFRFRPVRDNNGNPISVAQNMEPTNVIVSPNGLMAYVALPRNNAVARINLDTNLVASIYPLGNRSWSSYYVDASDRDLGINMRQYNAYSTYQASQVRWVVQNNTEWIISLDRGFINDIPEYEYADWRRGKTLVDSGVIETADTVLRAQLADETHLGRAAISIEDGIVSTNPLKIENVFLFGGRGISIRDSNTFEVRTTLVDSIERVAAQNFPEVFNTGFTNPSLSPQQDREASSPFLGPDLSVIESGFFQRNIVLFVGSASAGIIYVYVLSPDADCPQPYFHSASRLGSTFSSWSSLYQQGTIGDLGITDMLYINDDDISPTLIVASSISNSISAHAVLEAVDDSGK